ncbi:3799_t:CDS:2 [Dentiscutata heterogama]|uniref:3799_t:CDS:1 n=1 Tax=Dentiscutata heterogama TaxID=1316150 RepID=A0ACA9N778_9GLOM|nr:3799_t:CDS:2 [Dentiscutata heterogama]
MSKDANYEKYYKNALKKFTEIANETNSTTTPRLLSSSPLKYTSSSKMKTTYSQIMPFSHQTNQYDYNPIQQDHNSLTTQSYPVQHNDNPQNSTSTTNRSCHIKQSKNSLVNQSQIISQQKSNIDWPEEIDGWVYIKNSDGKADLDEVDKVEDYHCVCCKCAECTITEIDSPNVTTISSRSISTLKNTIPNHTTTTSTSTQALLNTKKLSDAMFEDDEMYLIL